MDLIELTDAEVKNLCRNVTPEMRDFCQRNLNWPTWPEIWLKGNTLKDPSENLQTAPPITVEQWWIAIFDHMVEPELEVTANETE